MAINPQAVVALRHCGPQTAVGHRLPGSPPVVSLGDIVGVERVRCVGSQDVGECVRNGMSCARLHLDPFITNPVLEHDAGEIHCRIATLPDELGDPLNARNLQVRLKLTGNLKGVPEVLGDCVGDGARVRSRIGVRRLKLSHWVRGVREVAVRIMRFELVRQQIGRHHFEVTLHDVLTLKRSPDVDVGLIATHQPVFRYE